MAIDQVQTSVDELLADAASAVPGAAAEFFKALLQSDVFVPLKLSPSSQEFPELGTGQALAESCTFVQHEGRRILPIFTQSAFVDTWAGREIPKAQVALKALLWLVSESDWLYLNPAQDFGKELSPWEIKRLREGPEAIADIVEDLGEAIEALEIEVVRDTEIFQELKSKLTSVLEVYKDVQEARLVGTRDSESTTLSPLLGITQHGMPAEKLESMRLELQETAEAFLSYDVQLTVADDLADPQSIYRSVFGDMVPFYIAQRPWPESSNEGET